MNTLQAIFLLNRVDYNSTTVTNIEIVNHIYQKQIDNQRKRCFEFEIKLHLSNGLILDGIVSKDFFFNEPQFRNKIKTFCQNYLQTHRNNKSMRNFKDSLIQQENQLSSISENSNQAIIQNQSSMNCLSREQRFTQRQSQILQNRNDTFRRFQYGDIAYAIMKSSEQLMQEQSTTMIGHNFRNEFKRAFQIENQPLRNQRRHLHSEINSSQTNDQLRQLQAQIQNEQIQSIHPIENIELENQVVERLAQNPIQESNQNQSNIIDIQNQQNGEIIEDQTQSNSLQQENVEIQRNNRNAEEFKQDNVSQNVEIHDENLIEQINTDSRNSLIRRRRIQRRNSQNYQRSPISFQFDEVCFICQEEMHVGEQIEALNCCRKYLHTNCISEVYQRFNDCPHCKRQFPW